MGDMADDYDEAYLEAKIAHDNGTCEYGCPWCYEDGPEDKEARK